MKSMRVICQEPFRIFFPAGTALGIIGVTLWPVYYLGGGIAYPNIAHARLMIEGLMGSFIFGFLGTAGPRLTSTPGFTLTELGAIFSLDLLAAGLHIGGADRSGDFCFLICLLVFATALTKRFRLRKDAPPPNFVLVALGIGSGMIGAALAAVWETSQYSRAYQFGTALLNECFVPLPVLGVAPFFIRRLLDLPAPDLPESRALPPEWKGQALFAGVVGLAIVASFWIDVLNQPKTGGWLRVAAIAFYISRQLPLKGRTFLADCLRIGILLILTGFIVIALVPIYRVNALHIIFITGFNLIAFTVAIRVVFGHSGNLPLLQKRLWFFILTIAFLFLAMISRFTADLAPKVRVMHLIGATICWLVGTLIWLARVIPKIRMIEPEI
jgi:uncharacterized protein involved in response to NO